MSHLTRSSLVMGYYEATRLTNCPAIRVTEKTNSVVPKIVVFNGCLVITVTEKGTKLWSNMVINELTNFSASFGDI